MRLLNLTQFWIFFDLKLIKTLSIQEFEGDVGVKFTNRCHPPVLIKNGADVNVTLDSGRNFLFITITKHPEIAQLLIDNSADVNFKNNNGNAPLFYVDDIEVARTLIKSAADINAKNNDGKTPLIAIESSLKSAQECLEEHNSFSENTFFKTELTADSKQRIEKIKESIKFLVESGGVK